jgi:fatty-acyl-CoA synthase
MSETSEAEIIEHVHGRLARFKAPSEVVFRDELPRTATGKVQQLQLREQLQRALAAREQTTR